MQITTITNPPYIRPLPSRYKYQLNKYPTYQAYNEQRAQLHFLTQKYLSDHDQQAIEKELHETIQEALDALLDSFGT